MHKAALMIAALLALYLIAPSTALAHSKHRYSHSATTFRTSRCKSAGCYRKHPDGKYVHPITPKKNP